MRSQRPNARRVLKAATFAAAVVSSVLLAGATCSKQPAGPIPPSEWGGQHIGMVVLTGGATIEYDCASGTIDEPIAVGSQGSFTVKGTHTRGHGGPLMIGEVPDRHPARYTGSTDGKSMTLNVTLTDSNQTLGTFTLTRGAAPAVLKCL